MVQKIKRIITDKNYSYLAKNLIWLQYVLHSHGLP